MNTARRIPRLAAYQGQESGPASACLPLRGLPGAARSRPAAPGNAPRQGQEGQGAQDKAKGHKRRPTPRPTYWGAWIGDQLHRQQPPWDMTPVNQLRRLVGKGLSLLAVRGALRRLRRKRPATSTGLPDREMETIRGYGAIPFFSWGSQVDPGARSAPAARLPALRRRRRHLRRLHPRIRRRRPRLGAPLLPALQLGDERRLVPLGRDRQRQPSPAITSRPGATSTTSSPRSAPPTRPGSGAPTPTPTASWGRWAQLYPGDAYVDWTCLTASTGPRTRPTRIPGEASTKSSSPATWRSCDTSPRASR